MRLPAASWHPITSVRWHKHNRGHHPTATRLERRHRVRQRPFPARTKQRTLTLIGSGFAKCREPIHNAARYRVIH